ncbi:MAG: hypothetical protein ACREJC_10325 [Tepidisphaeraceae bacterium]
MSNAHATLPARIAGGCLCVLLAASAFAQPATAPTTAAAPRWLADGEVSFVPPPGWTEVVKSRDGRTIVYVLGDSHKPRATMVVNADHQPVALTASDADMIGQSVCKQIRDNAAKSGSEILSPPKSEPDARFFQRVHHRFTKSGSVGDQIQLYRVIGQNLVAVAVTSYGDSSEQSKQVFDVAEAVMLSVSAGTVTSAATTRPRVGVVATLSAKPTALPKAKIRVSLPADWAAEINDAASGMVATCRDPRDKSRMIAISVRPLPREARSDPKLRDALVDAIVSGERAQFKLDGATAVGDSKTITDRRFLRKVRTRYQGDGRRFDVCSRQIRAGDVIVSVTEVCLEDDFDTVDRLADQVALAARAEGK